MPVAEMSSRLRESGRMRRERALWRNGAVEPHFADAFDSSDFIAACRELIVGCQMSQSEQLRQQFPTRFATLESAVQKTAMGICSGAWPMLGHEFDLRQAFDWHGDPRSDFHWQRHFYGDLTFQGRDVKYVWELGRHQYVVDLARAGLLGDDEAAATLALSHVCDWISHNPLYEGIHWTSALEVAMRAISWVWVFAAIGDCKGGATDAWLPIANSLANHATYLQNHLSYYSSPFNHLIGEATGLYLISFVLRQHPQSNAWRQLARRVLEEHGPRQFYSDGVCVEQAMGYHFFTLGFLSQAIIVARREGSPLTQLEELAHRGFRGAAVFRQPNGRWPMIGDLDSARSIPVFHQDYWQFGSLCSLAAVLFDDGDLAFDREPGEELFWLLGVDGWSRWDQLSSATHSVASGSMVSVPSVTARQVVLSESGYVVAAVRDDWLLFDAGPIAEGIYQDSTPSVAHGHADMLQILYWMNGETVLRDSGIPSYAGDLGHIDYFRSPAAHNTLEVEGAPAVKFAGQLAWSNVATTPQLAAKLNDDIWLARGKLKLTDGVFVTRYLLAKPGNGVWITDRIQSPRSRNVIWYWQLGDSDFQISESECSLELMNDQGVTVKVWSHTQLNDWEVTKAGHDSPVGWEATGYGAKRSGSRLKLSLPCDRDLLLTTYIGRAAAPWSLQNVAVGEHSLGCRQNAALAPGKRIANAEIIWTISDAEMTREYFAGLPRDTVVPLSRAQEVHGEGDWRVVFREQPSPQFEAETLGTTAGHGASS